MFLRDTGRLQFATLRAGDGTELQVMLSQDRVGPDSLGRWKDARRPRRPRRRHRRGRSPHAAASCRCWPTRGRSRPRRCARCPSRTSRCRRRRGCGSGTSTSSCASRRGRNARFRADAVRSLRESFHRARLRRGRDADAADAARRRGGPAVRHALQRLRPRPVPAHRARAVPQALPSSAGSRRSSRSTATSATRAPTPRTAPSSPCSSSTRRTATTTRSPMLTRELVAGGGAGHRRLGTLRPTLVDGTDVRPRRGVGPGRHVRVAVRGARSRDHAGHPDRRAARARRRRRHRDPAPTRSTASSSRSCASTTWCRRSRCPTFVRDFPVDTSPLVRAHRTQAGRRREVGPVRRGFELATGYSELVDPVVQRAAPRRAGAARRRRRRRGHAPGRGLPARHGVRHAADRAGSGMGIDRLRDGADRADEHPRDRCCSRSSSRKRE